MHSDGWPQECHRPFRKKHRRPLACRRTARKAGTHLPAAPAGPGGRVWLALIVPGGEEVQRSGRVSGPAVCFEKPIMAHQGAVSIRAQPIIDCT